MNDSKFMELLNLYLDHEIGAEGAAQLEAEVTRDLRRRRTYEQYCRIHKACALLAESSLPADDKVVVMAPPRRVGLAFYAAGLLAAAAAITVALIVRAPSAAPAPAVASVAPVPAATLVAVATPVPARDLADSDLRPVFSARAFTAGSAAVEPTWPGPLAWLDRVQLTPMPPAPPMMQTPSEAKATSAALSTRPADTGPTDLSAFHFEK